MGTNITVQFNSIFKKNLFQLDIHITFVNGFVSETIQENELVRMSKVLFSVNPLNYGLNIVVETNCS